MPETSAFGPAGWWIVGVFVLLILALPSIRLIGPSEVGLVIKRFGVRKLTEDNPIAFRGEAGYQADLLMPGWRLAFWILYAVEKHPWVQVPAGEIGVVIAQVGKPLPIGAKSARYDPIFSNYTDLRKFIAMNGQKGVQRPVLPPGTLLPIHPVGFLVLTKRKVYGVPIDPQLQRMAQRGLTSESFGVSPERLNVTVITPMIPEQEGGRMRDVIGVVTTLEGDPLPANDIAGRLGGFADISALEQTGASNQRLVEAVLGSKNDQHNNYQDFQAFLDHGGKIGLQHDVLLYGAYTLNPFLVRVEIVPMLVIEQGEVAVVKAYVGLATEDVSGVEFKHGSIVKPGHRGIWQEPLRTSKYPINPHCYQAEIVPTAILTLNWAEATSMAHDLDKRLQSIEAKSVEGFVFKIDLQVQIHVPDTRAPWLISKVKTMLNLVNEVLQAAVGNYFRERLQGKPAVNFIEKRQEVQENAFAYIKEQLAQYDVEIPGVFIQDVVFPAQLVEVLTSREIANQQIETYRMQKSSQDERVKTENSRGTADMQAELAKSKVGVDIKINQADARKAEADGEATYIRETGTAKGAEVRAVGTARAEAYRAQVEALGQGNTAIINAILALSESKQAVVPQVLAAGDSGMLSSLAGVLTQHFMPKQPTGKESVAATPAPPAAEVAKPEVPGRMQS